MSARITGRQARMLHNMGAKMFAEQMVNLGHSSGVIWFIIISFISK